MQNDALTIQDALKQAEKKLSTLSNTPHLEAELLLAHVLNVDKSYLFAWPEQILKSKEIELLNKYIERRNKAEPIAYILGHREFWSADLIVTPDTLVPRPETELIVELALKLLPQSHACTVADLGTGCGAIAVALASERPHWTILATDQATAALKVAKRNAEKFGLKNIQFYVGEWCEALPKIKLDAIVSNPPYLAEDDPHLLAPDPCELRFEPRNALVAGKDALADIKIIIQQAKAYLGSDGYLLLEHGLQQGNDVVQEMQKAGYAKAEDYADLAGIDRVTVGSLFKGPLCK
jgi:release factor glutamine methyltransferase